MDNAPESGPPKKPTPRTPSRPTATRKPPPQRKPTTRKPPAKAPAAPKPAAVVEEAVEELEFEDATVLAPRAAELREQRAAAANAPVEEVVEPEVAKPEVIAESEPVAEITPEADVEPVTEPEAVDVPVGETPSEGAAAEKVSSPGIAAGVGAWARGVAAASGARLAAARERRAAKALETVEKPFVEVPIVAMKPAKGKAGKELPDVIKMQFIW